jgi:hypothetical protein
MQSECNHQTHSSPTSLHAEQQLTGSNAAFSDHSLALPLRTKNKAAAGAFTACM